MYHVAGPPQVPPMAGMGMAVAMSGGGAHSKLVGQLGPYSQQLHSSSGNMSAVSNMYTPLVNIGPGHGGGKSVASGQHSVASLQMV